MIAEDFLKLNSLSKAIPLVPQWWHLFATLDQESDEHFYHQNSFLRHSNLKIPLGALTAEYTDHDFFISRIWILQSDM